MAKILMKEVDGRNYWFRSERNLGGINLGKCKTMPAMIVKPYFGFGGPDGSFIGLHFELHNLSPGGGVSTFSLYNLEEMSELLSELHVRNVQSLQGELVEILSIRTMYADVISVSPYLASLPS